MRALVAGAAALALCACPSLAAAQGPPPDSQFQKVTIDATPGEPIDLAVLPDGRVLHTERSGEVWLHDPATGLKTLAAKLDVYQHDEEGLQSIALDPNFADNGWVYLYYSPPLTRPSTTRRRRPSTRATRRASARRRTSRKFKGYIQLSRFKWGGSTIDLGSEQKILRGARRPRHLLPRRRRHRVRPGRQPAALDRRRHEPVRVRRVRADRRAPGP